MTRLFTQLEQRHDTDTRQVLNAGLDRRLHGRIRTAAQLPIDTALVNTNALPLYQQIAPRALQLSNLGLDLSAISRKLNVDSKTVIKGIAWLRDRG